MAEVAIPQQRFQKMWLNAELRVAAETGAGT
jgi:hypothetical protein